MLIFYFQIIRNRIDKQAETSLHSGDLLTKQLITDSEFHLTISGSNGSKSRLDLQDQNHIANIDLKVTNIDGKAPSCDPPSCDKCYLYVNIETHQHLLCYNVRENNENHENQNLFPRSQFTKMSTFYFLAESNLPVKYLKNLQAKLWQIVLQKYDKSNGSFTLGVYLLESGLTKLTFPAEGGKMRKSHKALQEILSYFYQIDKEG